MRPLDRNLPITTRNGTTRNGSTRNGSTRIGTTRIGAFLLGAVLSACSATYPASEVTRLIRQGQHAEAVEAARAWHAVQPGSSEAEDAYRIASVGFLLDRGRRNTFADLDEAALIDFLEAARLAPGDVVVESWVQKSKSKLAERWMGRARELVAREELEQALTAYDMVLQYQPESTRAKEGLSHVLLSLNYRAGLGETYYKEGVRSLRDYWLVRARAHFEYSGKYLGEQERVVDRRREVQLLLAQDRLSMARGLEQQGLYYAAHNEYRLTLLLEADNEEARQSLDRMGQEIKASDLYSRSERLLQRKDVDGALALAQAGQALTVKRYADFEKLMTRVEDARLDTLYQAAYDMERDYRFEDAVGTYAKLLAQYGYYKDARERCEALKSFIEKAGGLYEQAMAAPDAETAGGFYRQIEVFWPDYKDVRKRLAEAEKAR